ncbi:MAG: carboxylating nicotinate-nucleotide diphosphorylase [Flavobacteriales bacterium]|nr:carboxylating nicotinate-nucleotide diphosphorylase [Flavobacteriales bacterium]
MVSEFNLDLFIELALAEDVGDGDHSSLACVPNNVSGKAQMLIKEDGILAGVGIGVSIFKKVDTKLLVTVLLSDGTSVKPGDIAMTVEGSQQSILKAERLVLNVMQRMSGIATYTNKIVQLIDGTKTKVLDTRKTTPLLRTLEKQAVKIGGGENHRFGLYDMIMLKDNHIDYAGGIKAAVTKTKEYLNSTGRDLKIEVEARDLNEVKEILAIGGVDRIMLDNFNYSDTKTAVEIIGSTCETESSGGITIDTIRAYAECGVDYISIGALTHSIKSLDISLKATD